MQWSELQRDPKSVAELADKGDVRVRRRDGAALLLLREDRASSAAEGAVEAARALRGLLAHVDASQLDEVIVDAFPWASLLPVADRKEFVAEFGRAFQASADIGHWALLHQTMVEWKATAAVHADPALRVALTRPIVDDFGAVEPPVEHE